MNGDDLLNRQWEKCQIGEEMSQNLNVNSMKNKFGLLSQQAEEADDQSNLKSI